ncbi:MAG: DNA-processing protein DprA [Alphaproteobacteria bacterium]|nr:DNA-processing protein DprA [Alphaproteobacteria bacterium]
MSTAPVGESSISGTEARDRVRLIRSENVGPVTFRQLLQRYGSASEALRALPELAKRGGRKKPIRICPAGEAEKELAAASAFGAEAVFWGTPDYPRPLSVISDAPPVFFARGHLHLLQKTSIAMVGARNASAAGVRFARDLSAALGAKGFVVTSGLARGLDAAAHEGALATGTIAVVAGGLDIVYPPENQALYDRLCEEGLVVAEQPFGTRPQARHFPRRNRIISGLSHGVVVVEAASRSGSLITASYAAEQGREVFAVPGSPLDPRHKGTNKLIRDGAILTESAEDVADVLMPQLERPFEEPGEDLFTAGPSGDPTSDDMEAARTVLGEKLGPTPVEIDELIRQTGLTPALVLTILLELELAGRLDRHAGHKVSLV